MFLPQALEFLFAGLLNEFQSLLILSNAEELQASRVDVTAELGAVSVGLVESLPEDATTSREERSPGSAIWSMRSSIAAMMIDGLG
jgi:hypothetical protein